jgi:scyllo-inositol 2-dehydrogenase (NADP+)
MTIQVGLVGYGLSGSVFHAPFLQTVEGLELAAVVSSKPNVVQTDLPGVTVVPSLEELLALSELDLIVITSPNTTHFDFARQALLAGKHVVLEKPFTISTAEANELITVARDCGVLLSAYQNRRWDNDFLTIRRLLESGMLGELVTYEAHFDRYRPAVQNRWREQDLPGSGLLYDLGSHLIDQALVLFGTPKTVFARLQAQREGAQSVDAFHMTLDYGRLEVILRSGSLVREPGPRYQLHGTKGSFHKYGIDSQEDALREGRRPIGPGWGADREEWHGHLTTEIGGLTVTGRIPTLPGRYQAYYEGITAAIADGSPLPVTAEEARNTIRVIELAMQSDAEGRVVEFK